MDYKKGLINEEERNHNRDLRKHMKYTDPKARPAKNIAIQLVDTVKLAS